MLPGITVRIAAGLLALEPAGASVAPRLVLPGRVDAIAAVGDGGVAALRDGALVLVGADGIGTAGCSSAAATAGAAPRPDRTALSREEVLGEAGMSDEDVSPEAEELLDDEGLDPPPRRQPAGAASGPPRALALAVGDDAVWLGTVDGLWRVGLDDGACLPAGLGGREVSLVAARRTAVLALAGDTVWRSRDAGATFDVAAVLTSRAHALAVAADEETALLADEDGVVEIGAEIGTAGVVRRLEGPVDALAACGDDVVVLAGDGVRRLAADGRDALVGPRPPVRALACANGAGAGAGVLLAAGVGVWSSKDGAAWAELPFGVGQSFSAIASAGARLWAVTERGLAALEPALPEEPDAADGAPIRGAAAVRHRRPPIWAGLLPRVAVAWDGWAQSVGVAGWRVWLRATVTLGRRWQQESIDEEAAP
jgi:hypothetical protein